MTVISRRGAAIVAALLATFLFAAAVAAHAELTESVPADGSEVPGPFDGPITLSFSEALADNSHAELLDGAGAEIAQAEIPADEPARMVFELDQPLEPGDYRIEITAVADDGHIERPVVEFTVAEPEPTPEPTATPITTDGEGPSPSPDATASSAPAPSPTPSGDPTRAASTGEVVFPIIAAFVALTVLGTVLLRNRRNRAA